MNRPEFPNSAIVRAPERILLKRGRWRWLDVKVRYGLWRHPGRGIVLIDTGYTAHVTQARGRSILLALYSALLRPRLVHDGSVSQRLAEEGVDAAAVKTVIVTHFHPDHISALKDFTGARFVVSAEAWDEIRRMSRWQRIHHAIFSELLPDDFEGRLIRLEPDDLRALPVGEGTGWDVFGDGSCFAVPLPGHAPGHLGVLWPMQTPPLLYAADAQWLWQAIAEDRAPPLLTGMVFSDEAAARDAEHFVRAFAAAGGDVVLCHDPDDFPLHNHSGEA
jgi:glyoxylase-like metal-dependent hydrolase (beta-lactamase superfamily II)